jgi:sugar transferase (PEP-CTERM/EpsH1 system associated)
MCADSYFAPLSPVSARIRSLGALLGNRSLSVDYYRNRSLQTWVNSQIQNHGVKRVLVFSSAMAQYVEQYPEIQRVVDFVDVDSDKWCQYAVKKTWPMSWLYRHEGRQLLAYERRVARGYDASLFVSQPEAELFCQLAPESAKKIGYFSNGVDTEYFSPAHGGSTPYPSDEQAIVFTGAMDYWPNVDAVQWFATDVMPRLRITNPRARFYIVGARPSAAVQALARANSVYVTGTVKDTRPYLAFASVAVAPLRIARGIQNKVLEAMAMCKTIIVSPQALEGIAARPGYDLLMAEDADQFHATIKKILNQQIDNANNSDALDSVIGNAARTTVMTSFSWASNLQTVDRLLEGACSTEATNGDGNHLSQSSESIEKCL